MQKWPFSFVIAFILVLTASILSHIVVYQYVRDSYRAVGINDGKIHQQQLSLKTISENVPISICKNENWGKLPVELLTVKSDSLYIGVTKLGATKVCR